MINYTNFLIHQDDHPLLKTDPTIAEGAGSPNFFATTEQYGSSVLEKHEVGEDYLLKIESRQDPSSNLFPDLMGGKEVEPEPQTVETFEKMLSSLPSHFWTAKGIMEVAGQRHHCNRHSGYIWVGTFFDSLYTI